MALGRFGLSFISGVFGGDPMSKYRSTPKNPSGLNSEPLRTILVRASNLPSSYTYQKGWKKGGRIPTSAFKEGAYICPDMLKALKELIEIVNQKGGNFYITDLFRTWDTQEKARKDFLTGIKKDFVARPGSSFHNAGRAVDFDVKNLNFQGVPRSEWLEKLWELAIPLGFKPIIKIPDIDASEAWHMDFPGNDWYIAYDALPYSEVAKCTTLDIGKWKERDKEKLKRMFIQSQLIRLGYFEIGKVDGIFGSKTNTLLTDLHMQSYSVDGLIDFFKRQP